MKLYYYSLSKKNFVPLFPRTTNTEELRDINRYRNTSQGFFFVPLLAWAGYAAAGYLGVKVFGEAALTGVGLVALEVLLVLAKGIFWAAGLFMQGMGHLLDMAISITISSGLYRDLEVINVGWTTVRDLSNMFFIFALLYIAIKTILGLGGASTKRWVANLIIAALLINFSLFTTKVVIDAGNVLAMGFWERMELTPGGNNPSVSQHLSAGLKMQTVFNIKDSKGKQMEVTTLQQVIVYLGGSLIMLIAGYVFLAGGIMMIVRSVTLIFLLITSPFAFLSFALPVGSGFGQKWLNRLIGNAFVAPAFLAMLYLVVIIVNGLDLNSITGANGMNIAGVLAGDPGSFAILYQYALIITLILSSLTVASSVSSDAANGVGALAKKGLGYGAAGAFLAGGVAGRQVGGRGGRMLADSKWVKKLSTSNNKYAARVGDLSLAAGEKMKKGTWDARNMSVAGIGVGSALSLGGVNAGSGSKKTFDTHGGRIMGATLGAVAGVATKPMEALGKRIGGESGEKLQYQARAVRDSAVVKGLTTDYQGTEREKELFDIANKRYAKDPEARQAWLLSKGVALDHIRNKSEAKELSRAIDIEGVVKTVKTQPDEIRKAQEKRDDLMTKAAAGDEKATKDLALAEIELTNAKKALIDSIKKLSGKEFEEKVVPMLKAKLANGSANLDYKPETARAVMSSLGRTALMHINANPDILDESQRNDTANIAMTEGPEEARNYLITQAKLNAGHMPVNLGSEIGNRVEKYKKDLEELERTAASTEKNLMLERLKEQHDAAVQDILGGMKPKDVARLDNKIKSDQTLVDNYTPKHFDEIAKYHNTIKVAKTDAEKQETAALLADIRTKASKTVAGKRYMNTEAGGKAYGGAKPKVDVAAKKAALEAADSKVKETKRIMDEAGNKPDGSLDYYKEKEAEHETAKNEAAQAKAELDNAKKANTRKSSTDSGDDAEPEADDGTGV